MNTEEQQQRQVAEQCRAVVHLANALIEVHAEYQRLFTDPVFTDPAKPMAWHTDLVGRRTARFMEVLGDMLNEMDAASDEDHWLDPIFMEAHRLWPLDAVPPAAALAPHPEKAE